MRVRQTKHFARQKKKLHANQIQDLDKAVAHIARDPMLGEQKQGDLRPVRVHKFKMTKQPCLLAYLYDGTDEIILLAAGPHENFYRDLKQNIN